MRKRAALLLVLVFLTASCMVAVKPAFSSGVSVGDSWVSKASMPSTLNSPDAAELNGKIYVVGAHQGENVSNSLFEYDPLTDNWTVRKSSPSSRMDFAVAACNGKIYVIGGKLNPQTTNAGVALSNNEVYDPATDSWETRASMPTARYQIVAETVDGKIYVISGFEGLHHGVPVDFNQIYDPATDSWSLGTPIPEIVRDAAAGVTTGTLAPKRIYVIGGQEMRAFNFTQVYDPENDSWTMRTAMPTARGWLAVAVVNDLLYAIGGSPALTSPFMTTNEQYTPFGYSTPDSSPSPTPTAEPFPRTLAMAIAMLVIIATIALVVAICAGLLVYFKKPRREVDST